MPVAGDALPGVNSWHLEVGRTSRFSNHTRLGNHTRFRWVVYETREVFTAAIKHRQRIRLTIRGAQVLEQWPGRTFSLIHSRCAWTQKR